MHEVLGSSKIHGKTPTDFSYPHSSTQPQVNELFFFIFLFKYFPLMILTQEK